MMKNPHFYRPVHETEEHLMFEQRETLKTRSPLLVMQHLLDAVVSGDSNQLQQISDRIFSDADGLIAAGSMSGNPLRNLQYNAATFIHLVCYKCIERGLSQDVAYNQLDEMMHRVDQMTAPDQVLECISVTLRRILDIMRDFHAKARISLPVERCIDYIGLHLHRKITLAELAAFCGLSPSYLSRLFHRETGMPLSGYILRRKLAESVVMMREQGLDSKTAANVLEFSSQSYFIARFKSVYGVTPLAYCKLSAQELRARASGL